MLKFHAGGVINIVFCSVLQPYAVCENTLLGLPCYHHLNSFVLPHPKRMMGILKHKGKWVFLSDKRDKLQEHYWFRLDIMPFGDAHKISRGGWIAKPAILTRPESLVEDFIFFWGHELITRWSLQQPLDSAKEVRLGKQASDMPSRYQNERTLWIYSCLVSEVFLNPKIFSPTCALLTLGYHHVLSITGDHGWHSNIFRSQVPEPCNKNWAPLH